MHVRMLCLETVLQFSNCSKYINNLGKEKSKKVLKVS